jgi:hypothetical protein
MTQAEADRVTEGERVRTGNLTGTVVGATINCLSIQWDGRDTPEIYMSDDVPHIISAGQRWLNL